jgi:hypothetical protein
MEVLLNTRNISELIEKGEIGEIKDAMEKSMSPGSQTFEQDLFRLVRQGKISTDEALANADSATNLGLLLGNSGIMPAAAERSKAPQPGQRVGGPLVRRLQDHRRGREVLVRGEDHLEQDLSGRGRAVASRRGHTLDARRHVNV